MSRGAFLPRYLGHGSLNSPNRSRVEFRTFVEHAEIELLALFHSIDRDHNGKLDKGELKEAFRKAGLAVPNSKLDQFFTEVDENHDVCSPLSGVIHLC